MTNSHTGGQVELCCCVPFTWEEIDYEMLVNAKRIRWSQNYNRSYCTQDCTKHNMTMMHTYWADRLASSLEQFPYFVPSTWFRLNLQLDSASLPDWSTNWHTLYHGTRAQNIHKILENGFKIRECQYGFPAVYLSPSIHYSSHPRYARVVEHNNLFFQFVLEVRVDVRKLQPMKKREMLKASVKGEIDPNFPNNDDLEFSLKGQEGMFLKPQEGAVVTGVMVRKLNFDPAYLPSRWWWCKWRN